MIFVMVFLWGKGHPTFKNTAKMAAAQLEKITSLPAAERCHPAVAQLEKKYAILSLDACLRRPDGNWWVKNPPYQYRVCNELHTQQALL
jgi:hypothetical protein